MKMKVVLKEVYKIKVYCVKCESKIMILLEVYGEFMNCFCKFFEIIYGNKMLFFWYLIFRNYVFMGRVFCVFISIFF